MPEIASQWISFSSIHPLRNLLFKTNKDDSRADPYGCNREKMEFTLAWAYRATKEI